MRDYTELTKPLITLLILVCTAVGYWFGCGVSFHWAILAHALLGTALLASGTSALNQWYEVDSDAKMRRTRGRPLPAGRIKRETWAHLRPVACSRRRLRRHCGSARICWLRSLVCSRFSLTFCFTRL